MKNSKNVLLHMVISACVMSMIACNNNQALPVDVFHSLNKFGKYETKFERIIKHFQDQHDSLKLNACFFIINNIAGCKTIVIDSVNKSLIPKNDIATLSEELLIKQIGDAVDISRPRLLDGSLKFTDFCNYVLPYRFDNEVVVDWRLRINRYYAAEVDSLKRDSNTNDTSLCKLFNRVIGKNFKYVAQGNDAKFKDWFELMKDHKGNCSEMCKLLIYPLRAFGIPVTVDFTPGWANTNGGGHMWNVLICADGKNIPFMGLEKNPGQYNPLLLMENTKPGKCSYHICAKIFRKTFMVNQKSLAYLVHGSEIIPGIFSDERIIDVTKEYMPVSNLDIALADSCLADSKFKIAYLGIFIAGNWLPTAWKIADTKGHLTFENMGRNIMYIPMVKKDLSYQPADYPVYIDSSGNKRSLIPDPQNNINLRVLYLRSRELEQLDIVSKMDWGNKEFWPSMDKVMDDKIRTGPLTGKTYSLYYWNKGWKEIKTKQAGSAGLIFENVPANALYRVTTPEGKNLERCFTISAGNQVWW